jgi:predicted nucleic acid-binding protein
MSTTALDTNVLVALWDVEDTVHASARKALDERFGRERLVISGVVYAELLAAPSRTEVFLDKFCEDTAIVVEWELAEDIWREAGRAFQKYATRRREQKGTQPRRLLADFLIGAHAWVKGYSLLSLDAGMYRAAFPKLRVVAV